MTLAQQLIEQGVEKGVIQGIEKGVIQGIERGELIDKKNVLIKLISKKFEVSDQEKITIRETDSPELLDAALDVILFAESKVEVMRALKEQ